LFDILDSLTSSSAVDIEYSPDEIIASSATSESFVILEVSTFTTSFINVPSFDFIDFKGMGKPGTGNVLFDLEKGMTGFVFKELFEKNGGKFNAE